MKKAKNVEGKVRVAAKAAVEACTEIFGPACSIDADKLADSIINKTQRSDSSNWQRLVNNIEKAPISLRQCIIIRVAGAVHDYEVQHRTEEDRPLTVSEYSWCTHWWLLSCDQIIMAAKDDDVESVLLELRLVKYVVCGVKMITRVDDSIYRDGFYEVYLEYSRKKQRQAGVYQENLIECIKEGKEFYEYLPDIIEEDLNIDPTIPMIIKRDILGQHTAVISRRDMVSNQAVAHA